FLYGNATEVENVPGEGVNVFINEDAALIQSGTGNFKATVGITFDNSCKAGYDYYGNKLNYDWHMMSTPLSNAPINATYGSQSQLWGPVNIQSIDANCYFPNDLPMNTGGAVKWDFYAYSEPDYHWINLKRGSDSHWHMDNGQQITYTNEESFVPGKGYMMAINQDSYMSSTGTLTNKNFDVTLTNGEPESIAYNKGWNLVGNPYQAYLDLYKLNRTVYAYDAETGTYIPYTAGASTNPATLSQFIHPHQAFFAHYSEGATLSFTTDMATTETTATSYFRDSKPNYPLVNLFAENASGNRDLTIIEFNRPTLGGATKIKALRSSNFQIAAHLNGQSYGLLFTPEDTEKVPVHFQTAEDGTYTLTWNTQNGDFTSLLLVDNKTGVITDMLRADHYTFDASKDDYSSRFYLTYAVTGVDENGASTGSATFAFFDGSEWVVNGQGTLDVVDVLGRIVLSQRLTNDQNRVGLNGVAPGVYMMRVTNGKNVMVQKVVVK
ncbi:MAG: T9SS type A sorting domain-containing protein, partial [Bacteroidales bacterium]|nr:T9SS type A sorting domain-containing protein [Bacteroidales bacterium]